jgi:small-conductance mechanosensitive channel
MDWFHFDVNEWTTVNWSVVQTVAIWAIVAGTVVSLLAKLAAANLDPRRFGIIGAVVVGLWYATRIFPAVTQDWQAWIAGALVAAVLWWLFIVVFVIPLADANKGKGGAH